MTRHRKDRVFQARQREFEDEEAREMDEEAREVPPRARLGVPGRGEQEITGNRPAAHTGEVQRR